MDPIVLVTIVLGATIILAFYITKIFKGKSADSETALTPEDVTDAGEDKTENIAPVAQKTKKKALDKKQKEKGFVFQHPWLLSTLKGHSGRVLGILTINHRIAQTSLFPDICRHGPEL